MELTRRDAVAALAALGLGGGAVGAYQQTRNGGADPPERASDEQVRAVLVAVAAVVYPAELAGTEEFVETFVASRLENPDHGDGLREAVYQLQERSLRWHDSEVPALEPEMRDELLREVGADTASEDPEGTTAERIRYYVVNELLLALYSSPTGAELVGIENPQGHPGGTDTYQRGPQ